MASFSEEDFFLSLFYSFWERDRETETETETERERIWIPSRLHTVSTETPHRAQTHARSWSKPKSGVGCLTDWATQAPFRGRLFFLNNLLSRYLTYNVYHVVLASRVDSCDSSLTYHTQCSSQQVPSSMPISHFLYPTTPHPYQPSVCSLYFSLPPSLFKSCVCHLT